jgi:hypothetical protein
MPDPLDALRLPRQEVEPRPGFSRDLLGRLRSAVEHPLVVTSVANLPTPSRSADDALDEALEQLVGVAPEFDPFHVGVCITNHAPMMAEALCVLDCADDIVPWVERYGKYLDAMPSRVSPISSDAWRDALGDYVRVADWIDFFAAELADEPWRDVANRWLIRLGPGSALGLHGLVRVAHAVRGVGRRDTLLRRRELAVALGYLAAVYETLPDAAGPALNLTPSEALLQVEQLPLRDRTGWLLFTQPLESCVGSGRSRPSRAWSTSRAILRRSSRTSPKRLRGCW